MKTKKVARESQIHSPSKGGVGLCAVRGMQRTLASRMPTVSRVHPSLWSNDSAPSLSAVTIQHHGERPGGVLGVASLVRPTEMRPKNKCPEYRKALLVRFVA